MKLIIEPFKIKTVNLIRPTSKEEYLKIFNNAVYNSFLIKAEDVIIELL
jgi:tryptophanase